MNLNFKTYKFRILILFFLSIFLITSSVAYSQHRSDNQLAMSYFQNKEYEKAAELYLRLYNETGFKNHRDYYIRCLRELRDFETAENFLSRELRRNRNDFYLMIDLGEIYLTTGNLKQAEEQFKKAVDIATESRNNIFAAASTFQRYRNFIWAEKVYLTGEKKTGEIFDFELGNIYFMQRNYEKMINSYVSNLKRSPQRLNIIQSRFQYILSHDIDANFDEVFERILMQEVQKNPQITVLTELLIWQFTQTGKFEQALRQLISLDRRLNKDGREVFDFGRILTANLQYELAAEAFQYVVDKGRNSPYYSHAYVEYLNSLFIKYTRVLEPDIEQLRDLETKLEQALTQVRRRESFSVIHSLAQIKAFYLEKYDEAIEILLEEINKKMLNPREEAIAKLLLGDIYMLNGNPWEATLIYAQVEKENSESPIGHEARFKRAKLAYYTGEFEWAQAQLVVLKAATSKLIANDALELSVFISDNFNLDTTHTPMKLFARADFLIFTKQYNDALMILDSILSLFPGHKLKDNVLFRKANIYEEAGNYIKASDLFNEIATTYYYDILADKALFRYALLQEKLQQYDNAEDAYFKLISEYPASIFAVEARKKLRELNARNLIN